MEIVRIVVEENKQRVTVAARAFVDDADGLIGAEKSVYGWEVDEQRNNEEYVIYSPGKPKQSTRSLQSLLATPSSCNYSKNSHLVSTFNKLGL